MKNGSSIGSYDDWDEIVWYYYREKLYNDKVVEPLTEEWLKVCDADCKKNYELSKTWNGKLPLPGTYQNAINDFARKNLEDYEESWSDYTYTTFKYEVTYYNEEGDEISTEEVSIPFTPEEFNWNTQIFQKKIKVPSNAKRVQIFVSRECDNKCNGGVILRRQRKLRKGNYSRGCF